MSIQIRNNIRMPEVVNIDAQMIPINNYIIQQNNKIQHRGYIDSNKEQYNIRILVLNPRGCRPSDETKIQILINRCEKFKIDILTLNETNTKWNAPNRDKIRRKLHVLGREIIISTANSNLWSITKED